MSTRKRQSGHLIAEAWLVLVLGLAFGATLAGVHVSWSGRIAENKRQETLGRVPILVPGADRGEELVLGGHRVLRALKGDEQIGWVLFASGQGFADRIELLIGTDLRAERLSGLWVLDQKETPGLGDRIRDESWRAHFLDRATNTPLEVTKGAPAQAHQIPAVTGATISSETVCEAVNATLKELGPILRAHGREE